MALKTHGAQAGHPHQNTVVPVTIVGLGWVVSEREECGGRSLLHPGATMSVS